MYNTLQLEKTNEQTRIRKHFRDNLIGMGKPSFKAEERRSCVYSSYGYQRVARSRQEGWRRRFAELPEATNSCISQAQLGTIRNLAKAFTPSPSSALG